MDFTTLVLLCLLAGILWILVSGKRAWRNGGTGTGERFPPQLPDLPFVGSLPLMTSAEKLPIFFMEKSKNLGSILGFYMGSRYLIIFTFFIATRCGEVFL